MVNRQPVDNIVSEHVAVRQLVSSVGNYMNDLDAIFRLETERFNWTQTSLQALTEKKTQLAETIDTLWINLKKHFTYEEQHLTVPLGEILTKALIIEHEEISKEIERVKALIKDTKFEGLSQSDALSMKASLQQAIGRLSQMIEEHAKDEEVLVKLVKKVTKV